MIWGKCHGLQFWEAHSCFCLVWFLFWKTCSNVNWQSTHCPLSSDFLNTLCVRVSPVFCIGYSSCSAAVHTSPVFKQTPMEKLLFQEFNDKSFFAGFSKVRCWFSRGSGCNLKSYLVEKYLKYVQIMFVWFKKLVSDCFFF